MRATVFAWSGAALGLLVSGTACAESGPYVRLDAGWSWARDARLRDAEPSSRICNLCADTLNEIGSPALLSGGVGYRFNDRLRADVTVMRRINIRISDRPPAVYFTELLAQCDGGALKYGGIADRDELAANLRQHAIPDGVFGPLAESYDAFLEERRKLMAAKIRVYFQEL